MARRIWFSALISLLARARGYCYTEPGGALQGLQPCPQTISEQPLPVGPPLVPAGAELEEYLHLRNSWHIKNHEDFEKFIKLRAAFVEEDTLFDSFRRSTAGADGVYGAPVIDPEEPGEVLGYLETEPFGRAVLESVLPRVREMVDGFGSPRVFKLGRHGQISLDLMHALLKLAFILRSLEALGPIPGQHPPPKVRDIYGGPELSWLLGRWDVVEIGAGPGLHAAAIVAAVSARSYSIVDLPTQQQMQYKVLARALGGFQANSTFCFVPLAKDWHAGIASSHVLPHYDLLISTYAFSELAPSVRMRYFYVFIVRSRRGFIIDNYQDWAPKREGNSTDNGDFVGLDLIRRLQDLGFDARVETYQQYLGVWPHRSRAVIISWVSTAYEGSIGVHR